MSKALKTILIIIFVAIIIVVIYFLFFRTKTMPVIEEKGVEYTQEEMIEMAQELFKEKIAEGVDMTNGHCLTNQLIPDWVVDIAHSPRQDIDNLPENQCSAYREGLAHHFIELDLDGNLIKIY